MRVTKVVREYIEAQVRERIKPRYQAEATQAEVQEKGLRDFEKKALEAAAAAYNKYLDENLPKFEYLSDARPTYNRPITLRTEYYRETGVSLTGENSPNHVTKWHSRMEKECDEKSREIMVELELGAPKSELEAMINKV